MQTLDRFPDIQTLLKVYNPTRQADALRLSRGEVYQVFRYPRLVDVADKWGEQSAMLFLEVQLLDMVGALSLDTVGDKLQLIDAFAATLLVEYGKRTLMEMLLCFGNLKRRDLSAFGNRFREDAIRREMRAFFSLEAEKRDISYRAAIRQASIEARKDAIASMGKVVQEFTSADWDYVSARQLQAEQMMEDMLYRA